MVRHMPVITNCDSLSAWSSYLKSHVLMKPFASLVQLKIDLQLLFHKPSACVSHLRNTSNLLYVSLVDYLSSFMHCARGACQTRRCRLHR
jgi:hypothetical protein